MIKPKILLLYPNTTNAGCMPLAVGILTTIAMDAGFDVEYFETTFYKKDESAVEGREKMGEFKGVNRENFIELLPYERMRKDLYTKLSNFKPDIFAVTCNTPEYEFFCELLDNAPSSTWKPYTIVGGVHSTVLPEDVIANPYVDALCMGEGEGAWEEFLLKFKNGDNLTKIKNLWVKDGGIVHKNPMRPLMAEIDLWERPLYLSFFDERHYRSPFDGKVYCRGQLELSRGCPYSCTYCVNTALKEAFKGLGKFYRVRPLDNLKKAVSLWIDMGADMMQFQDECFFSVPQCDLEEFCKWYGNEVRLPMMIQSRPETITDEKISTMAAMEIPIQISIGIESGSKRVLEEICNRKTKIKQIVNAFKIIKKYRLRSTAFTMIGFPTETRDEVFETIKLIRECEVDISIMSVFFPFEGTPLKKYCIDRGYITGKEKTKTFTDTSVLKNQPMLPEEIQNIRRTYSLYSRLPDSYFPQIELCERDYEHHRNLYTELVSLMFRDHYKVWEELRSYKLINPSPKRCYR